MPYLKATSSRLVSKHGAIAGNVLQGAVLKNKGLRLRVQEIQSKGYDGPIKGSFVILDAGDNVHTDSLSTLLDQVTTAEKVLGLIRRQHAGCVNVVNANILSLEELQSLSSTSIAIE